MVLCRHLVVKDLQGNNEVTLEQYFCLLNGKLSAGNSDNTLCTINILLVLSLHAWRAI